MVFNLDTSPCWEKNRKMFFDFLSPRLGINVSLFRLRQFEEVVSELGSPHPRLLAEIQ